MCRSWGCLMNNPFTIAFAIAAALAAVAFDQYRDARWDAERQHQCDMKGC